MSAFCITVCARCKAHTISFYVS